MEQYIPKSALLAEIDKRIKVLQKHPMENHKTICHLDSVKQSVNSLEGKEVDLEEEIEKSLKRHSMLAVGKKDFTNIAKYFFELGLHCSQTDDSYIEGVKGSYTTTDKD